MLYNVDYILNRAYSIFCQNDVNVRIMCLFLISNKFNTKHSINHISYNACILVTVVSHTLGTCYIDFKPLINILHSKSGNVKVINIDFIDFLISKFLDLNIFIEKTGPILNSS